MKIGVPKEIKSEEYRVALVPSGVDVLKRAGHDVLVQNSAGLGSGFTDDDYRQQGAEIVNTPEEIFERADMIIKVKEPLSEEYPLLKEGQILFTYLHLAASLELTKALMDRKIIGIAYETVELPDKRLPLLIPMSEIAGRLASQEGAKYLERPQGGLGVLLGGVPGVLPAKVTIIGGGTVGTSAARIAAGMGADVTLLDVDTVRLRYLDEIMPSNVKTLFSNSYNIIECLREADLVVMAVLIHGAKAPCLVKREMLKEMKKNAVIVDVAIDQGGGTETSRPTTHKEPVYEVDGVIHYCVPNMPSAVPRTATYALTNVTLPYALELANKGWRKAIKENEYLKKGVNICLGEVTYKAVAETFELSYTPVEEIL